MTSTQTRTDAGLATGLRISVSRLARRLRVERQAAAAERAVRHPASRIGRAGTADAMSPGELAEHEKVQPPSMTRVISALEE